MMMNNNFATFFMVLTFLALSVVDAADKTFDLKKKYEEQPTAILLNVGDNLKITPAEGLALADARIFQIGVLGGNDEKKVKNRFENCKGKGRWELLGKSKDGESYTISFSKSGTYFLANKKTCDSGVKVAVIVTGGDTCDQIDQEKSCVMLDFCEWDQTCVVKPKQCNDVDNEKQCGQLDTCEWVGEKCVVKPKKCRVDSTEIMEFVATTDEYIKFLQNVRTKTKKQISSSKAEINMCSFCSRFDEKSKISATQDECGFWPSCKWDTTDEKCVPS